MCSGRCSPTFRSRSTSRCAGIRRSHAARLAVVPVLQFAEGMTDRQAADAVRGRVDWKFCLSMELTDPGFDASVLSEFRARLAQGDRAELLLTRMLEVLREHGLLVKEAVNALMPQTSWRPCGYSTVWSSRWRRCGRRWRACPWQCPCGWPVTRRAPGGSVMPSVRVTTVCRRARRPVPRWPARLARTAMNCWTRCTQRTRPAGCGKSPRFGSCGWCGRSSTTRTRVGPDCGGRGAAARRGGDQESVRHRYALQRQTRRGLERLQGPLHRDLRSEPPARHRPRRHHGGNDR